MFDQQIYKDGVWGVLKVVWTLKCKTPLVLRNGERVIYKDGDKIVWNSPGKDDNKITALCFGYEIVDQKIVPYYCIPSSSFRGSLRSWTIQNIVKESHQDAFQPLVEGDEKNDSTINLLLDGLKTMDSGCDHVVSLFGYPTLTEYPQLGNAGRLMIDIERFDQSAVKPLRNGEYLDVVDGPGNVSTEIINRNPLDRISHASKEPGLHHFLEVSKGVKFSVELTILNPIEYDLKLVDLWKKDLDYGLLRIGALSSIGRGRVEVIRETMDAWCLPGKETGLKIPDDIEPSAGADPVFKDFWNRYAISQPASLGGPQQE